MSEKKTSGIKNFFEEFKAFAMRGNVLDMAVGVVVGSAFTAIVNSLVNDIISPIIGLFFNADFSDVVIQIGDVGIGVGAFLNAIINFLIVAFVLFLTIKAINMLHKKPVEEPKEPTTKKCPYCQSEIAIKAVAASTALRSSRASPKQSCNFPCFLPGAVRLWTPPGLFCALFRSSEKKIRIFSKKVLLFRASHGIISESSRRNRIWTVSSAGRASADVQEVTGSSPVPSTIQFVLEPDSL